jgi:hypothetical protein
MFLHIGNGKSVKKKEIIGIFDLDTATVSKTGKNFINKMQKEGRLEYDDFDLPRSFVLADCGNTQKIYLSRISAQGLKLRFKENTDINN